VCLGGVCLDVFRGLPHRQVCPSLQDSSTLGTCSKVMTSVPHYTHTWQGDTRRLASMGLEVLGQASL
jgi:hypothetical protein